MRRHAWSLVSIVALGWPIAAAPQCTMGPGNGGAAVSLRLHLAPGQSRRMVTTTDQSNSQTMMGQAFDTHQVMRMGVRLDVDRGASEGAHRVGITYETVRVEMDTPMGHTVYDSSDPQSDVPMIGRVYSAIVNHTVTAEVARDGSVTGVEGVDSLLSDMVDSMPEMPGMSKSDLRDMMRKQLSDQVMAQAMRQAVQAMPARPVAVGDSWTCPIDLDAPMPLRQRVTWTVRSLKDGIATVDVTGDMTTDSTVSVAAGPASVRYALKGTNKSTMEIDAETGWVIRSKSETEMSGTVTMSGGQTGDMEVPMKTHLVSTTEPAKEGGAS